MAHPDSRLTILPPTVPASPSAAPFVRLARLRKLRECEQVAAVCYRMRGDHIEFLLVRTRSGGRWTFPKGSAEPGLTHAQAAALEAFEEAGVHGRMEEEPFIRYVRRKPRNSENRSSKSRRQQVAVNAHLCEVLRLSPPQESKRHRTWFSVEDAKRVLREGRKREDGGVFARVVDSAVVRIQQLHSETVISADRRQEYRQSLDRPRLHPAQLDQPQLNQPLNQPQKDALQKVPFEYAEALPLPQVRRQLAGTRQSVVLVSSVPQREVLPCEVLEFSPTRVKKARALGTGTSFRG